MFEVYFGSAMQFGQFLIDQFGVGEYRPAPPARDPVDQVRPGFGGGPAAAPGRAGAGGGHQWGGGGRPLGRQ